MCRCCFFKHVIFISFTKKLFEGVINLHYMSAKARPNFCGSLAGGGGAIEDTMHLLIGEGGGV